jgi:hypothetical protein
MVAVYANPFKIYIPTIESAGVLENFVEVFAMWADKSPDFHLALLFFHRKTRFFPLFQAAFDSISLVTSFSKEERHTGARFFVGSGSVGIHCFIFR